MASEIQGMNEWASMHIQRELVRKFSEVERARMRVRQYAEEMLRYVEDDARYSWIPTYSPDPVTVLKQADAEADVAQHMFKAAVYGIVNDREAVEAMVEACKAEAKAEVAR